MQKFAAFVTYLRTGLHALWIGLPLAAGWYWFSRETDIRIISAHYFEIWMFKHHRSEDVLNQYIAEATLYGLVCGLLSSFLVFLAWVIYTRRIDMEFTRSSVGVLTIGCLLVGFCFITPWLALVPWYIGSSLGATLLWLETQRMRVLAATY